MIILFNKKEDCCGCTACMSVCPKRAITMQPDEEGFLYPYINQNLCMECGLCERVCPFQNGYDKSANLATPDAYAVKHKNLETRMNSRSGGMFTAVSDFVLDNDGVVYGVGFKEYFKVCHKRATTKRERNEFRGSKYVQSEMDDIYSQVKKDLREDKLVLFSGTPCQTAGLNAYLGGAQDKLILCDIVCHGTPSPMIWNDYLSFMENKYNGTVIKVDFRNKKRFGWAAHRETLQINGKEFDSRIYTTLFYNHDALRPACFNCKYTNMKRPSDITLADFWGIDEAVVNFNDDKGVSLIFINNEKARKIFKEVKGRLDYKVCTGKTFIHPNLKQPTQCPSSREQFWQDYHNNGFANIAKKYAGDNYKGRVKKFIKKVFIKLKLLDVIRGVIGKGGE